jgi:hypothetical protein
MNHGEPGSEAGRALLSVLGVGVLVFLVLAFGYRGAPLFYIVVSLCVAGGLIWALLRIVAGREAGVNESISGVIPSGRDFGNCLGVGCLLILILWIGLSGIVIAAIIHDAMSPTKSRDMIYLLLPMIAVVELAFGAGLWWIWHTELRTRKRGKRDE